MSIERQYGEVMFVCDECGDEGPSDESFNYMKSLAKRDGWLVTKDDETDEWIHICPGCVKLLPKVT